jgi:hypothetical protein
MQIMFRQLEAAASSFAPGSMLLWIEGCCFHGCSLPYVSVPPSVAFIAPDACDDGVEVRLGRS